MKNCVNKEVNATIRIFTLFLLIALMLHAVYAAGVVTRHTGTIYVEPGKTVDISYGLQNMVGDDPWTVKVDIINGSDIVKITDESNVYTLQAKTEKDVNMRISVPSDAPLGKKYNIALEFNSVTPSGAGMITMGIGFSGKFTVIAGKAPGVEEAEEEKAITSYWWIAVIVVLLIILALYLLGRKR